MARRFSFSTALSISLAAAMTAPIVAPLVCVNVCRAEDAPAADVANSRNSALAEINSDGVYIRSGPGDSYYPTTKLNSHTPVTVVGEKFDWLKIVPPKDSFCYVAKAYIDKNPDGTASSNRDDVNIRAGSELNTIKTSVQTKLSAGQRVQIRIFGRSFGSLARPERELAEAIVVDQVGSGRTDAVPTDHAQEDADVLDQSRLVHLRSGKSCEARVLGLDDRFGAVALRRGDCSLSEVDRARHDGATPTWTFRNRAGAAPWLTCACWPGCPLPQLVRP